MNLTSKHIVPITTARARLTELADEVAKSGEPKLITKNGESYVALITAEQLDELRRFQLAEARSILRATAEALEDVNAGRVMTWDEYRPKLLEMRDRLRAAKEAGSSSPVSAAVHRPEPPARLQRRRPGQADASMTRRLLISERFDRALALMAAHYRTLRRHHRDAGARSMT